MQKWIIVPAFVLLFLTSGAADTTAVTGFKRLYAGVSFTPGASYRLLSKNYPVEASPPWTSEEIANEIIDRRNKYERPNFAFNAGLRLGIRATRFFSIETGIDYARRSYYYKQTGALNFVDTPTYNFVDTTFNSYVFKTTDVYHYLNLPLAFNFCIGKKKFKAIISTGAMFKVLLKKQPESRFEPFTKFNLSPFLGAGVEYHFCDKLFLRVMPVAQMQALKNIDTPITEHLISGGINAALYFDFLNTR